MFKKFKESPYCKVAFMLLICGAILITFAHWISTTHFSVGFETINKTLAPVYVGILCSFIVCPVYNACVKFSYKRLILRQSECELTAKDRRRFLTISRIIATLICVVIVVGFISSLLYVIVPQVVTSCMSLADTLPDKLPALSSWLTKKFPNFPQFAAWVDGVSKMGVIGIVGWIQDNILSGQSTSIAVVLSNGLMTAVSSVVNTVVGILIMVYILNYKETLFAMTKKFITASCSEKKQNGLYEFVDIFNDTFINYIVGRIIDSIIVGIVTYAALLIFKIPYPAMIGMIVGATNIIPFFGPFIGAIPSFLIIMLESPLAALEFVIIVLVIQQLDGNILDPIIVGDAVGLGSFWVLLAVLIGGGLFGFMGMVFGVPVFAVIYRYVNKFTTKNLVKKGKNTLTSDYFTLDKFGIDAKDVHLEVYKTRDKSISDKIQAFKGEKEDR